MKRMAIDLPETFPFAVELDVRIGDVNYGRHLGNDALVGLLHEARLRFLAQHGFSEMDVGGVGLIMADLAVVFKAQAFHGDQLRVEVAPTDPGPCGFDLVYRVSHGRTGRDLAQAKTALVCFDYERQKVARLPEACKRAWGWAER